VVLAATLVAVNPPVFPWVLTLRERVGPVPWPMVWILFWILAVGLALLWMYLGDERESEQ
jgi:uncharacterized membrane protein YeiB